MMRNCLMNKFAVAMGAAVAMTISALAQTSFGPISLSGASSTATVTVPITAAGTIGTISVGTQGAPNLDFRPSAGGSCIVNRLYAAGRTCTVNVTFTPKFAGTRAGAVVLYDRGGNVMGTVFVAGTGVGPQIYYPGNAEITPSVSGGRYFSRSVYMDPNALAVDGRGNIFYANSGYAPNDIFKLTPTAPGSTSYIASSVDATLLNPLAVAVDGAGNVYASSGGYRWTGYPPQLFKYTALANGSYTPAQPIAVGQFADNTRSTLGGLAVDGSGNLFISDNFAGVVYRAALLPDGTFAPLQQIASGLTKAWGAAVDGSGNVYVAADKQGIIKLTPHPDGTYSGAIIDRTWWANGIALDGIGNIYIAQYGQPVELVLQPDGSYIEKPLYLSGHLDSLSVAVDSTGNVFVGDGNTGNVLMEPYGRQPQSLTFASTAVGKISSDSPQTLTLGNNGNMPLTFADIAYPVDFPEALGIPGECPVGKPLDPNDSCTLTLNFNPSISGPIADPLLISDNVMNMQYAQQTILLNGTGTGTTRIDAWWNPYAQITYGANLANVLNATASVPGTFVYTTYNGMRITTSTIMPAGNTTLRVTFTPRSRGPVFQRSLVLTVLPKPLMVTPINKNLPYMSQVPTYAYTLAGFVNGDKPTTAVIGIPNINANATAPVRSAYARGNLIITAPVGNYPLVSAWGSLRAANYTPTFGTGTLTIVPASTPLTITAKNLKVSRGSIPSKFAYTVSGMVGFDSQTNAGTGAPVLTTPATAHSAPGTYPIILSAGNFAAPNYSGVRYVSGTLTIW